MSAELLQLLNGVQTMSIVGMCKNAGKTTMLNWMLHHDRLHIRQPQANARNRPAAGGCQAATYCFAVARHAIRLEKTPTAVVATPVALLPISTCLLRNAPEGMRPCSTSM